MAPTLRDVSYLLGLPLRGDAMGPTDVGQGWREDLPTRFGRVQRSGTAPPYREFAPTHTGGPPKWWILQFKADDIGVGATEYEIARHLEAYVLWLMGWVMFCSSAGSFVPKHLLRFARYVADAPLEAIPQFSRGSAVLAATYRGLCTGCLKSSGTEPIFGGVRYFAAPGSREVSIGRPAVLHMPYQGYPMDDVDGPTMGSLWCDQRFAYAHVRTRKSYPDFVGRPTSSVTMRYGAGTTPQDSYGAAQAPPGPQGVARAYGAILVRLAYTEELGYSQLHDAPPRATRRSEDQEAVHDSPPPRRT
ncbi:hypothetical protein U9M48_017856 [Paspalum notatum var. saurae]|uniref:Uncharacterized protein n=1 Tax=Paspalum notatum var. saurae TaxID=547442 RepID=A0AAQ3TC89_PASNO